MIKPTIPLIVLALCQCGYGQFGGYGGGYGGGGGGYSGNGSPGNGNDGNGGFSNLSGFLGFDIQTAEAIRLAHGVIASLAFVIFFPVGAIFMRIIPGRFAIILHALTQLLAYVLYIVAFGLGVWMASTIRFGGFDFFQNHHPIIGIIIFVFLFFQPILGIIHHLGFRKHGRRGLASYVHLWLGRILITLGIINGGLGLQLAGNAPQGAIIAYSIVAAVFWLAWMAAALFGEARRMRNTGREVRGNGVSHAGGTRAVGRHNAEEEDKPPQYA